MSFFLSSLGTLLLSPEIMAPYGGNPELSPSNLYSGELSTFLSDHAILLVLFPLILRFLLKTKGEEKGWSNWVDLALAYQLGIAMALLHAFWLYRYYLDPRVSISAMDFEQYCALTGYVQTNAVIPYHYDRSLAPAYLPGFLARLVGVMDGLALSSLLSSVVLCSSLYLWARALHSRTAGVAAAILSGCVMPIVLLSRNLSYYPMWAAGFSLCSAGAAIACRYRTIPAILFGSAAAGLALLIEVRGLIWALPCLGLVFLACLDRPWKNIPLRLWALLVPISLSYLAASQLNMPTTPSLEDQVGHYMTDSLRLAGMVDDEEQLDKRLVSSSYFLWGHSNPLEIPNTLWSLMQLSTRVPELAESEHTKSSRNVYVMPWVGVLILCGAIASFGFRHQPWRLLIFWGTVLPFVAALWKSATVWAHMRMLSTACPVIPILLALAFATLVEEEISLGPSLDKLKPLSGRLKGFLVSAPLRLTIIGAVLLAVVTGIIPTWLSGKANWRPGTQMDDSIIETLYYYKTGTYTSKEEIRQCVGFLQQDVQNGLPVPGRIYPPNPVTGY